MSKLFDYVFEEDFENTNSIAESLGNKILDKVHEGKTARHPVDIGDGFYARKIGFDVNGNWAYWIQQGSNKAKKVYALDINGGKNKITDLSDFSDPDYSYTVEMIKHHFKKYLLGEASENMVLMHARLEPIPETLSYNVDKLNVKYNGSTVNINDAGILSLDMDEEELVKRLMRESSENIVRVDDIQIEQPPSMFKFDGSQFDGKYTISVKYTTDDGQQKEKTLDFNDLTFTNADKLLKMINNPQ